MALTFYHAPNTRSTGVLALLEELGAPHELKVLNLKAGEQFAPAFAAINPMNKVPTIVHNGAVVTEQVAIYIYLADTFAEAKLAPALSDPLRGPYLRWMVYYAACFEPALTDRMMKRDPAPRNASPYADYDTMLKALTQPLAKGPYILGERFTAADVLWGGALGWMVSFKLVPELPVITDYVARVQARPSFTAAKAKDEKLAAEQAVV